MARVTGIGGVFNKSNNDSKALAAWYKNTLILGFRISEEPYLNGLTIRRKMRG